MRGGVDDVTPARIGLVEQPVVEHPAGLGELDAVVDALDLHVVGGDGRADPVPGLAQDRQDVGEVLLALALSVRTLPERVGQERPVEGVDAGVDLADRPLGLGRRPCARRSR